MKIKKFFICYLPLLLLFFTSSCSYLPEEVELLNGVKLYETPDYISLLPESASIKGLGFMFYAGGLVDAHAYIPTFQELAREGYAVVIIKSVSNLAILNSGKSQTLLDKFEGVEIWVLGGHSLGAVVACMDVASNPENYKGLVLLAGYPTANDDLSNWDGTVLSIWGELDGLLDPIEIEDNKKLLPTAIVVDSLSNMPISSTAGQSLYHEIKGGNHAQFGTYGEQKGDNTALISTTEQHQITVDFIRSFFNANNW